MMSPFRRLEAASLARWRRLEPITRTLPVTPRAPEERIRAALPAPRDGKRRRIVIIADQPSRWRVQRWLRTFHGEEIEIFADGFRPSLGGQPRVRVRRFWSPWATRRSLMDSPPPDLIIDTREQDDVAQADTWRNVALHVPLHGWYVHWNPHRADSVPVGWAMGVAARVGLRSAGDVDRLIEATASVRAYGDYTVQAKGARQYLRVPDRDADRLHTRHPRLRVQTLATVPAQTFESRARVHSHVAAVPIAHMDTVFEVPELTLRHYEGEVRVSRQMLTTHDHTILPPSFRNPSEARPGNVVIREVDREFATVPPASETPAPTLEGDYFDLNAAYHGHFGHFMIEVVGKLWAWDEAKRARPALRALVRIDEGYEPVFERAILTAYGIPERDIVWQREDAVVTSYLAATPMWQNQAPYWAHPGLREVWARLRDGIVGHAVDGGGRRLFVSRRPGMKHRDCTNSPAVETLFREYGFEVIYPEDLTTAEQATLFAGADVIAGFGGSAMFNVLFSEGLKTLIVLNQEAYLARNEHLYSSILECDTHYFWSTPLVPHPPGGWSGDAFRSAWEFDFARNEGALRELLASLEDVPAPAI